MSRSAAAAGQWTVKTASRCSSKRDGVICDECEGAGARLAPVMTLGWFMPRPRPTLPLNLWHFRRPSCRSCHRGLLQWLIGVTHRKRFEIIEVTHTAGAATSHPMKKQRKGQWFRRMSSSSSLFGEGWCLFNVMSTIVQWRRGTNLNGSRVWRNRCKLRP